MAVEKAGVEDIFSTATGRASATSEMSGTQEGQFDVPLLHNNINSSIRESRCIVPTIATKVLHHALYSAHKPPNVWERAACENIWHGCF